jgi:O-antigen/teichoic acid export membrane protein
LVISVVSMFLTTMVSAATFPMIARIFPKERFGQFAAATAMVSSLMGILCGGIGGAFLDMMQPLHADPDYAYRYISVWQILFMWIGLFVLFALYLEWKKLGGLKSFKPPDPGEV